MIEDKDLRIGNILFCDYIPDNVIVSGICSNNQIETNRGVYDLESLDAIPLTEEWLVKFGFVQQGIFFNKQFINSGRMMITLKDFSVGLYSDNYAVSVGSSYNLGKMRIKHVHSLQNLYFALTGEELTIKEL